MKNDKSVEVLKVTKSKNKYIVETNIDKLECSENQLIDYRIFKGKIFELEEWKYILENKISSDLFNKTLNFLSYKMRTEKEIKEYLKKHTDNIDFINQVIDRLKNSQLINDDLYTKDYIKSQISNLKGPKVIELNLSLKGINKEIINKGLLLYDEELLNENICTIIEKELPKIKTYPIIKQKEKIKSKLIRLGYIEPFISLNIRKFHFDADVKQRLEKEVSVLIRKGYDFNKIKNKLYQKGYNLQDIKNILSEVVYE